MPLLLLATVLREKQKAHATYLIQILKWYFVLIKIHLLGLDRLCSLGNTQVQISVVLITKVISHSYCMHTHELTEELYPEPPNP